ncbi:MAG TPA: hypothetical protein ENJ87_11625, partial [Gammaproteobacteria bacterium]|nr:hypothetical protein [Gammaproteobacteria bacterium]
MAWEIKEFYTNQDGTLSGSETKINIVQSGIKIDETVGDELFLKSGDLRIVTDRDWTIEGLLPPTAGYWVSVYKDGQLFGVYSIMHRDRVQSFKYGDLSEYRLRSLQSVFYQDIAGVTTNYSATSSEWNNALNTGAFNLNQFNLVGSTDYDRYAFSLGDIFSALSGKHDDKGYLIDSVSHPIPTMTSTVPALIRGHSKETAVDTLSDAVEWTFYGNPYVSPQKYWDMTWKDMFKIASFGWNAFILVRPKIVSGQLKIDLEIIPKSKVSPGSTVSTQWVSLKKEWYKHKLSGVKITIINDEFTQGDTNASNVFDRSLDVANPAYTAPPGYDIADMLYWIDCSYRSATVNGYPDYDQNDAYFETGKVEPYYSQIISKGHGYKGKCIYEGQKLLD